MKLKTGGGGILPVDLPNELFIDSAKKRVSVGLILGEFIKSKQLKADQAKVDALITNTASAYEDPEEVVGHYRGSEELMQQMERLQIELEAINLKLQEANKAIIKHCGRGTCTCRDAATARDCGTARCNHRTSQ